MGFYGSNRQFELFRYLFIALLFHVPHLNHLAVFRGKGFDGLRQQNSPLVADEHPVCLKAFIGYLERVIAFSGFDGLVDGKRLEFFLANKVDAVVGRNFVQPR